MKHFGHLTEEQKDMIFYKKPQNFTKNTKKELLSYALGATLYMPSTREKIAEEIINKKYPSLTSLVMCLEDAIGNNEIESAEKNILKTLDKLNNSLDKGEITENDIPLMFIRVRNSEQLKKY